MNREPPHGRRLKDVIGLPDSETARRVLAVWEIARDEALPAESKPAARRTAA